MDSTNTGFSPISTGSLKIDLALPEGGLLPGTSILIHGPTESGKTALCLLFLAQIANNHGATAFIDLDHRLETWFALAMGVSPNHCFLVTPKDIAQALEIASGLISTGALSMLVIDSFSAHSDESEQVLVDKKVAAMLPSLIRKCQENGTILVLTQQTQPGAVYHGLHHHLTRLSLPLRANLRFELDPVEFYSENNRPAGFHLKIKKIRGKVTSDKFPIEVNLLYNQGVEKCSEILEAGIDRHFVLLQNTVYMFKGLELGRSRKAAERFLEENPEIAREIEQVIRIEYGFRTNLV